MARGGGYGRHHADDAFRMQICRNGCRDFVEVATSQLEKVPNAASGNAVDCTVGVAAREKRCFGTLQPVAPQHAENSLERYLRFVQHSTRCLVGTQPKAFAQRRTELLSRPRVLKAPRGQQREPHVPRFGHFIPSSLSFEYRCSIDHREGLYFIRVTV